MRRPSTCQARITHRRRTPVVEPPGRVAAPAARWPRWSRGPDGEAVSGDWPAGIVRSGDLVVVGQGVGEPTPLLEELLAKGPRDVEVFVGLSHSGALTGEASLPLVSFGALGPLSTRLQIWHTIYNHVLEDAAAIVEWVKGTGLRPFVDPLEPPERKQYLAEYTARVAASYLPQADGKVLLRFPRIFIVAVK